MNPLSPSRNTAQSSRRRALVAVVLFAAGLSIFSVRQLGNAIRATPEPPCVGRFRLEQREGRFFRPGSAQAFEGWVIDYHPDRHMKLKSKVVAGLLDGE